MVASNEVAPIGLQARVYDAGTDLWHTLVGRYILPNELHTV